MRLFDEAGVEPAFQLRRTAAEALISAHAAKLGLSADAYDRAKREAASKAPRRHRAESDARHLAVLWAAIEQAE